ncbi:unnamed protein product, partial [Durusdinium trenchii]
EGDDNFAEHEHQHFTHEEQNEPDAELEAEMLDENDETEATEPLEEPHEEEREEQPHYDDGLDDEQEYEKPEGPEAPYEDDDGDSDTEVLLTWSKDKRGNYIQHEKRVKREPQVEEHKPPIEK